MSDLVGTLEDRFSRVAAHLVLSLTLKYAIYMYREETSRDMQPLLTNRHSTLLIPFNSGSLKVFVLETRPLTRVYV